MGQVEKLTRLAKRMQKTNQTLCFGYGPNGGRIWWLEPSQKVVDDEAARRAVESGSVQPCDMGLFGDLPQSYRVTAQ